jgi:hypothetical protein
MKILYAFRTSTIIPIITVIFKYKYNDKSNLILSFDLYIKLFAYYKSIVYIIKN